MDADLRSIQQAREMVRAARHAQHEAKKLGQDDVDRIVMAMVRAGATQADRLGRMAHEETGFGRPESKRDKNLFATRTLGERMRGMRTVGVIRKLENDTIWEVATPMGVIAALIPSTNPTSTAMYKAIISAKARCGVVMSPHPRAARSTAEALDVVARAATSAGAPEGLFACMTEVSLAGTEALLEDPEVDLILATGGTAMVRAAYSKGKPAYGVGSGNVPVYVDRSADVGKAAQDLVHGVSFDWGTLCSTERSVVCDQPVRGALIEALKAASAHFVAGAEADLLRNAVVRNGKLNVDQVGQSPEAIAEMAGFRVPRGARALVCEVTEVGPAEPLSRETLSPILTFYTADGWEAGCDRCMEVLAYGGMGHTLALHAQNERVIEAFALQKPAMRIVVNSVAALGSVGYTNRLFPAMTLGPGTVGGSITSDNISPMHLLNIKRVAFETDPVSAGAKAAPAASPGTPGRASRPAPSTRSWIDTIEQRLRDRAGNAPSGARPGELAAATREAETTAATQPAKLAAATGEAETTAATQPAGPAAAPHTAGPATAATPSPAPDDDAAASLTDNEIDQLVRRFRRPHAAD